MAKKRYNMKLSYKDNLEIADLAIRPWLSIPLAKLLIRFTNITANQVTWASFFVGILGGYFLLKGDYTSFIYGGILALFSHVLDQIDGTIARVKNTASLYGKWLDGVTGHIRTEILILALAFGLNTKLSLTLGVFAALAYPLYFLMIYHYKVDVIKKIEPIEIGANKISKFLGRLYGCNVFYLVFPLLLVLNKPLSALLFFAMIGNLAWMFIIFLQYRKIKDK